VKNLRYEYIVDGASYYGTSVAVGHPHLTSEPLPQEYQTKFRSFMPGGKIQIFYDETDPSRSTIEKGGGLLPNLLGIGTGIGFLLVLVFRTR
jgi:hypothetical protein